MVIRHAEPFSSPAGDLPPQHPVNGKIPAARSEIRLTVPKVEVGSGTLSVEDVEAVSRRGAMVVLADEARDRIRRGRHLLDELLQRGESIYGVNTGFGGNIGFQIAPEHAEALQHKLVIHLGCGTGAPLGTDVVRAAMLLRVATFARGTSGIRPELADALIALLNSHITPIVPRYGSVGASGDLIPSAYVARVLAGLGEVEFRGNRIPALRALEEVNLPVIKFAPKEGLSLVNGTTMMTAVAALQFLDAQRVLRALLAAAALSIEALRAPSLPFAHWVNAVKGHPGQIEVAAHLRRLLDGSLLVEEMSSQTCYSLRCLPQGLGPAWESLEASRAIIEREVNSANDNPLIDLEDGQLYRAGNFYGGHIARVLDTWKIDYAIMANWANALMAVLVDERFNRCLPPNLVLNPGLNSGFKGMQLSITSLTCMIRQLSSPSSIHSLPTEQYNQDVVSLGMHAAVTSMDSLECLRSAIAMILLASAQAVDLREGHSRLGKGTRLAYDAIRDVADFLLEDRSMENEIRLLAEKITAGELPALAN